MRELQDHKPEATEIHAIKPAKSELKFERSLIPQRGQKVFQLDLKTKLITEAEYDEEVVVMVPERHLVFGGEGKLVPKKVRNIIVKENCLYWPAINAKNADRHFAKMLGLKLKNKAK